MNDTDLAYAAGLVDGEGAIQIQKHRRSEFHVGYHYCLTVAVAMCDATAPMWLYSKFGGSLGDYAGRKAGYKREYKWTITTRNARRFLSLILPYLKTKKAQAEIAIEFQNAKSAVGHSFHKGHHKPKVLLEAEAVLANKVRELNRS